MQSVIKQLTNLLLFTAVIWLAAGCMKEKKDSAINPLDLSVKSSSSLRFFNFLGYDADVIINNISLTSFSIGGTGGTAIGLALFPSGKWTSGDNGSPFTVPNSLVNKDGTVRVTIYFQAKIVADTVLVNDVLKPVDYYVAADGSFKAISRQTTAPAGPENFKIRIIHLGQDKDPLLLDGLLTLSYADGTPVSPKLSGVRINTASDYVELPYGAYQFKLFAGSGAGINIAKQLAELPMSPLVDGCNPSVLQPQQGIFPRVRTFSPGGIYSLVVTANNFSFWNCDLTIRTNMYVNAYRIVTEYDPGVNYAFARMQAVNALPGKKVRVTVDGSTLGNPLDYAGNEAAAAAIQSPYKVFIQGNHQVQALDENGSVLAEAAVRLFPYDNYTIWVHEKPDGKPGLLFSSNDMTSTLYASSWQSGTGIDDGTDGTPRRTRYNYAWQSRFINLCPNLPYATFTNDEALFLPAMSPDNPSDSIRYLSAYVNQASGRLPVRNASLIYTIPQYSRFAATLALTPRSEMSIAPRQIRVYESTPGTIGQVPGRLITSIAPLSAGRAFIANPALYAGGQAPAMETGIYTVALVGRMNGQGAAKAKLIAVRHHQ